MHDGMPYDTIQGQGHESFKFANPATFKSYLLRHLQWELATWPQILKLWHNIQIWSGRIFLYLS